MDTRQYIFDLISVERARQDELHPDDCHGDNFVYLAVLMEEVGEVSKAILENDHAALKEELIHVAAVATRMLEFAEGNRA